MPTRPVLLPTDGSACAELARPYAERLAAALGVPLVAVHISPAGEAADDPTVSAPFLSAVAADVAADLRLPADAGGDPGAINAASAEADPVVVHRADDPARGICAYAAEIGAGFVVMGTHGRSGVGRLLLGSVAEAVLQRVPCPVLLVRTESPDVLTSGRVLVATDLSPASEQTVDVAADLARRLTLGLGLLHVVEPLHAATPYGPLPMISLDPDYEAIAREAGVTLHAIAATLDLDVEAAVRMGHPADVIVAQAQAAPPALLVVGSHGVRGLEQLLVGSVAGRVAREATCPVLVVRGVSEPEESPDTEDVNSLRVHALGH